MSATIIYKYPLSPGLNVLPLPQSAKILSAERQHGNVFLWAIHSADRKEPKRDFVIRCAMTGLELPPEALRWRFINTVLIENDSIVVHVFEESNEMEIKTHGSVSPLPVAR